MKRYNFFKTKEDRRRFYLSIEWRKFRELVLARDNHECLWCKKEGKVTTVNEMVLEIDHIKELQDRPDLALDMNNLQTLCRHHHNVKHNRVFTGSKKIKKEKWRDEKW